jgi:hypothetical protein
VRKESRSEDIKQEKRSKIGEETENKREKEKEKLEER